MNVKIALTFGIAAATMVVASGMPSWAQTKVKIATASASMPGTTARIVKQLGLFEKYKIDADVVSMDSGSVASAALFSGSVQFFTAAGTEIVVAQARGIDMVAVAAAYKGIPAVVVVKKDVAARLGVAPDSELTQRIKALSGLTIAAAGLTGSYPLGLRAAIQSVGGTAKLIDLAQQAMPAALETGAIDAFISSSPFYGQPVLRGTGVIWLNATKGELPKEATPANSSVLYTMRSYAKANPEVINGMRAAYVDFAAIAGSDPDRISQTVAQLFPNVSKENLDLALKFEMAGFITTPLSKADFEREIAFVKLSTPDIPGLDKLAPEALIAE